MIARIKKVKAKTAFLFVIGLAVIFSALSFLSPGQDEIGGTVVKDSQPVNPYALDGADEYKIQSGQSFSDLLKVAGVNDEETFQLIEKARPHVEFRYLRPGQKYYVLRENGNSIKWVRLNLDETTYVVFEQDSGNLWDVKKIEEPVSVRLLNFAGKVQSSLWESAIDAKMDPSLISELTELFAWQVDFAREVRAGDRWRLTVEERMASDRHVGWGRIVAAEYQAQEDVFSATLYRRDGQDLGYFMPSGESLRRMFLKSPVRFSRISSRFNRRRFHPILKRYRPHLGVDYSAASGTPVRAVGDGKIDYASRTRGGGNTLKIRHNSVYKTHYKHLKGFAKGIRRGSKVKQGQVIGYVGSTGLSTGPHLHFEFYENGRYVDPLGKKFPSAAPVPSKLLGDFKAKSLMLLGSLPSWDQPMRLPSGGFELVSRELTEKLNKEALEN